MGSVSTRATTQLVKMEAIVTADRSRFVHVMADCERVSGHDSAWRPSRSWASPWSSSRRSSPSAADGRPRIRLDGAGYQ